MVRVLFVCLGNICRSPAAEGIFRAQVRDAGLEGAIEIDSAGTSAYHSGAPADSRMRSHARERGYELTSLARGFDERKDFTRFDYIVTMDESNYADVSELDSAGQFAHKILPMVGFCTIHSVAGVPDPYYGGEDGFRLVLDILEDACAGLLNRIREEKKL